MMLKNLKYVFSVLSGTLVAFGIPHAGLDHEFRTPIGSEEQEVQKLNRNLQNFVPTVLETWAEQERLGKSVFITKDYKAQIRQQLRKIYGNQLDDKTFNENVEKVAAHGLTLMKGLILKEMWLNEDRDKLRIRSFYDLSNRNLPEEFQKLVDYFRNEYHKDITSARVLLVDGLAQGQRGLHLGRHAKISQANTSFSVTVGNEVHEIAANATVENFPNVVDAVHEKLFGAKDIILINAHLFNNDPQAMMAVAAHEARHMIDQEAKSAAYRNYTEQQKRLARSLNPGGDKRPLIEAEADELRQDPAYSRYLKAVEIYNVRLNPQVEHTPEFRSFMKEVATSVLETAKERFVSAYLDYETDYESRAHTEQMRYARVIYGWDREKALKRFLQGLATIELPDADRVRGQVRMPNAEVINVKLHPIYPYLKKKMSYFYDAGAKRLSD